ncbi:type III secretion system export apparatus subunit SctT [Herbaspirillum sp. RTI4]|uniref:type III secretion system export apparatus subunit SctT n=1 Tax=Herbaspirillum sp. RTI4 TaxID=3048640 RepID=UPI002AB4898E|nr:type III secretion system export apparatus subunit SctT [Herbaspirillum sp. RTI4]MDY7577159.1 type III secretion system export apparatus subunit SctT [Herbaspirillum sp. RTI4]MEA9980449.1 type III secretion system export apparatus subunit SctT [Herbaspirillum sp. RTI4]
MLSTAPVSEVVVLQAQLSALVSALPRLLSLFVVLPFFVPAIFGGALRAGLIAMCAVFVAPRLMAEGLPAFGTIGWWLLAAKEAVIGIAIAFACSTIFWAIENVGFLIDLQTGASNAQVYDPMSGHESGPTGNFLRQLAIAGFMGAGGLPLLLGFIFESYRLWPVHALLPNGNETLLTLVGGATGNMFDWTVRLVAPVILVLLGAELLLGLLGRFAQQLNVFSLSQPLKALLAVFMLSLLLQAVLQAVTGMLASLLPGADGFMPLLQQYAGARHG